MSHWYLNRRLFDESHPEWGKLMGWPKNKDGTPKKRINDKVRADMGLLPSVTDILKGVGNAFWMPDYFGDLGIRAAVESGVGDIVSQMLKAKTRFNILRSEPAERGQLFHKGLEEYFKHGIKSEDKAVLRACVGVEKWMEGKSLMAGHREFVVESNGLAGDQYAGTVDYLDETMGVVVDYKSVSKPRNPYFSECAQLAAYAMATKQGLKSTCINLYISQETGEILGYKEWDAEEKEAGWTLFVHAHRVAAIMREHGR